MTIGIGVSGPQAGLAAFTALRAVEAVARGAIGGFVSFVAIGADGTLMRADTQRGGTTTLFTAGETTGVAPPPAMADARFAALMSSGPNRPVPLSQFTPGAEGVGLVTGHRLPNLTVPGGGPLNEEVLSLMAAGRNAADAVRFVDDYPDADAGVIAIDADGAIALANSLSVARRDDVGAVVRSDAASGLTVGVLHNAIFPVAALADLAVSAAFDVVAPQDRWTLEVSLRAGLKLTLGERPTIFTTNGTVVGVTVAEAAWLGPHWEGAAIARGAPVFDGGQLIGHSVFEPYCLAQDGALVSMSGRSEITLRVRTV
ncbi:MAG: hypothetical protein AAGJ94_04130 [Pseudomonadota bacterium]